MPYMKCRACHHCWETGSKDKNKPCGWCGVDNPMVLEEQTPLEKFIKSGDAFKMAKMIAKGLRKEKGR